MVFEKKGLDLISEGGIEDLNGLSGCRRKFMPFDLEILRFGKRILVHYEEAWGAD